MSLVVLIFFDDFYKKMIERFNKYNINYIQVHFEDLDQFFNSNHAPIKIFVIMGSIRRILRDGIHPSLDRILNMPEPVIGICYGFQYMAMRSGGILEDGAIKTKITDMPGTIGNKNVKMWVNHFDKVKSLLTYKSAKHKVLWKIDSVVDGTIYMAHTDKWLGFQFHPEYRKKQFEEFILPFVK
jgi:GMP synthase-like glutamine amidotransferase